MPDPMCRAIWFFTIIFNVFILMYVSGCFWHTPVGAHTHIYNLYLYICDRMRKKNTYNTSSIFLYLLIYVNLFDFVHVPIFSHTPSSCASRNSSSSWPSWPFWSSWTFWPLWSSWPSWPFWSSWTSWPARTMWNLWWFMNDFLMHSSHSLGTVLGDSELASYIQNQ